VIPFRFPTVMEGIGELEVYLETEGHDLLESLQRLRDCVQMEVRFSHHDSPEASETGKQYLQGKHRAKQMVEHVADTARDAFGDLVMEWHTRDVANGLRCYALVARPNVPEFRQKGEAMKVSGEVQIAVTGPWPPTEFLSDPDAEL
jgi:gas vesicle protein GvpL/GvpF